MSTKRMHTGPEEGLKYDTGKPDMRLVFDGFPRALMEVGKNATFGAKKYSDHNWLKVDDGINRYTSAMYRHLLQEASGEEVDEESEVLHAAMAAWNALARLELILRNKETKEP